MKENLRVSLNVSKILEKVFKKKLEVIGHVLENELALTDQLVVELAEMWNQTKRQCLNMERIVKDLVSAIEWNKELFDGFGKDWEFDKELPCKMTLCEDEDEEEDDVY